MNYSYFKYFYFTFNLAFINHHFSDCFQIGKGVCQVCILSPCSFNLFAKYIMRNAGLEEAQAGIRIAGRNVNNLRYADDTTLMAENEEELDAMIFIFWMLSFRPLFSLFHLLQEALQFLFAFCLKDGIICISEVVDNRLVPNWKRSMSSLYIVTLLI